MKRKSSGGPPPPHAAAAAMHEQRRRSSGAPPTTQQATSVHGVVPSPTTSPEGVKQALEKRLKIGVWAKVLTTLPIF